MTIGSVTGIALVVALSWVGIGAIAAAMGRFGLTSRVDAAILSGAIIGLGAMYVAAEALTALNWFTVTGIRITTLGGVAIFGTATAASARYRGELRAVLLAGTSLARRQPVWVGLNALGLLLLVVYAPSNFDGLSFHTARAAVWLQNGSLSHFPTHFVPQLDRPPVAEVLMAWARSISGTWDAAPLVQWQAGVLLAIGIRGVLARLAPGLDRLEEFTVLVAIGLSPMIVAQTTTPQVDLVSVALIVISAVLVVDAVLGRRAVLLPIVGLGLGMAIATKGTAVVGVAALAVGLLPVTIRHLISIRQSKATSSQVNRRVMLAPGNFGTIALCACGLLALVAPIVPTFVRNHETFGTLSGPEQGEQVVATNDPRLVLANAVRQFGPNIQMGSDGDLSHTISLASLRVAAEIATFIGGEQAATSADINFPSADPWAKTYPSTATYHEDVAASPLVYLGGLIALVVAAVLWRRRSVHDRLVLVSLMLAVATVVMVSARFVKLQYWVNRLTLPITVTVLIFGLTTLLLTTRMYRARSVALWPVAILSCWIWLAVTISGPTRPLIPIGNEVAQHRWASTSYDRYFGDRVGPGRDFDALEEYLRTHDCDAIAMKSFIVYELPLHVVAERTGTRLVSIDAPDGPQAEDTVDDYCMTVEENGPNAPQSDLPMPFGYLSVQLTPQVSASDDN